jgi:hypothetical protein
LKSLVANSSEGPLWTNIGQSKYWHGFPHSEPIAVPHVSISPFMVVAVCQSAWQFDVIGQSTMLYGQDLVRSSALNLAWTLGRRRRWHRHIALVTARMPVPAPGALLWCRMSSEPLRRVRSPPPTDELSNIEDGRTLNSGIMAHTEQLGEVSLSSLLFFYPYASVSASWMYKINILKREMFVSRTLTSISYFPNFMSSRMTKD